MQAELVSLAIKDTPSLTEFVLFLKSRSQAPQIWDVADGTGTTKSALNAHSDISSTLTEPARKSMTAVPLGIQQLELAHLATLDTQ